MVASGFRLESQPCAARFDLGSEAAQLVAADRQPEPYDADGAAPTEGAEAAQADREGLDPDRSKGGGKSVEGTGLNPTQETDREVQAFGRHPSEGRRHLPAGVEVSGQPIAWEVRQPHGDEGSNGLLLLGQKTLRIFQ
jgi:hypothetical protein